MPTDNRKKTAPLFAVPEMDADAADSPQIEEKPARRKRAEAPAVCQRCFGTGTEVVPGNTDN